ncbi:carbohydrate ABC transporter permease [Subtercola boreus]|uniref:carbohydrate ABC transporter permease n=1 Tax=Subtercola boreus TaxID=120213 RepID=UPI0011C07861|nr:sugar ABC transporter permease [Subtercola boreus]
MTSVAQHEIDHRPPTLSPVTPRRSRTIKSAQRRAVTLLTAPGLIWYAVFMVIPAASIFVFSLLDWPGLLAPATFAGFSNYAEMVADPVFWTAVLNTLIELGVDLAVMIPVSFMLGYYLTLKRPGHRILRVLFFTPALLSLSARALVFFGVLAPNGLVNGIFSLIGLGDLSTPWLANPDTSLAVVMIVDLWGGIGFTAILFAARLASVSPEIYEAAELDGATSWRKMWSVAMPVIRGFVGIVTMLQFAWILFGSATTVLLLTRGGPGSTSTTLSFMVYNEAFVQSNIGYSQAIGVVLFIFGLLGMLAINRSIRQRY